MEKKIQHLNQADLIPPYNSTHYIESFSSRFSVVSCRLSVVSRRLSPSIISYLSPLRDRLPYSFINHGFKRFCGVLNVRFRHRAYLPRIPPSKLPILPPSFLLPPSTIPATSLSALPSPSLSSTELSMAMAPP